jgi:cell division protein FtsB
MLATMSTVGTLGRWFYHTRRILATLCIGVLAVLIAYKVVFGANGTVEWRAKRSEYQRLQHEIDADNQVHQELETRVIKLQNDRDTIIKEAREKLGYLMPGEVVLVQPQPKPDVRTSTSLAESLPAAGPKNK